MRHSLGPALAALLLSAFVHGADDPYAAHIPKTPALSPEEERLQLVTPPGFEVELVASEPDIRKPMNIAFDDRGRLWVTDTIEYPFPAKEGTEARDSVRILEDADGDGRAEKVTVFASGMNIPIGIIPVTDGAIVFSIPKIWRLIDHDGDGKADEKKELYGTFGNADTHGLTGSFSWGFDGWIYAHHGYANKSDIRGGDGSRIELQSGNTYRFRPDGSRVEQYTHGQVNPFGMAVDPLGNFYTADCHTQPVYMLLEGAWYPSFGKPHDGLGYGPAMIDHDHGGTGVAGIAYYAADAYPEEYRDTVVTGNVMTNRVNHDSLERRGSTLWTVHRQDFIASKDPWFRPVAFAVGPDGNIYVADFYNRVIGHYEVPLNHPARDRDRGRIWRVVHRGSGTAPTAKRPPSAFVAKGRTAERGPGLIPDLLEDLASGNLTVRTFAANGLVELGAHAIDPVRRALQSPRSAFQKAHALWVLERLASLEGPEIEAAAKSPDAIVRTHVQKILSRRSAMTEGGRALARAALEDADAFVRRAGAETLGNHPASENLSPLLDLLLKTAAEDTHLVHATRMAIRDQMVSGPAWELASKMDPDGAEAKALAGIALGVPTPDAALFLMKLERAGKLPGDDAAYARHVARHSPPAERESAIREVLRGSESEPVDRRLRTIEGIIQGTRERGAEVDGWIRDEAAGLARSLIASDDDGKASAGLQLSRSLKIRRLEDAISSLARSTSRSMDLRKSACDALAEIDGGGSLPLMGQILADPAEPLALRQHAADVIGNMPGPDATEELLTRLRSAPERVGTRIASSLAKRRRPAERLCAEIEAGKASPRLLQDREVRVRLEQVGIPGERIESLTEGLVSLEEKSRELMDSRLKGYAKASPDPGRGKAVFEKTCAPCHKLGSIGTKVGPDLNGIGDRGLERLIEDVLDPSRIVDQAFRTTVILQEDGVARSGLLVSDEGEILTLVDTQGKPFSIAKSEVKSRDVSNLSPMPSNIAEALPEAEFHDLMAFLLRERAKPE